jgi:hypothetical protein
VGNSRRAALKSWAGLEPVAVHKLSRIFPIGPFPYRVDLNLEVSLRGNGLGALARNFGLAIMFFEESFNVRRFDGQQTKRGTFGGELVDRGARRRIASSLAQLLETLVPRLNCEFCRIRHAGADCQHDDAEETNERARASV